MRGGVVSASRRRCRHNRLRLFACQIPTCRVEIVHATCEAADEHLKATRTRRPARASTGRSSPNVSAHCARATRSSSRSFVSGVEFRLAHRGDRHDGTYGLVHFSHHRARHSPNWSVRSFGSAPAPASHRHARADAQAAGQRSSMIASGVRSAHLLTLAN
jgi:hypothetical protein